MSDPRYRAGFSLMEALVVLAIGGMALAIIFSLGVRAGDTGFGLGRRAMAAADTDMNIGDLRVLLRSTALRPTRTFQEGDRAFIGEANRLETDVVMERATQCAPQGWAGRMVLTVEAQGGEQRLTCQAGGRRVQLIATRGPRAAFSYSTDRRTWGPAYTNAPSDTATIGDLRSETIWIRFHAPPTIEVVEHVGSGRPEAWMRTENAF